MSKASKSATVPPKAATAAAPAPAAAAPVVAPAADDAGANGVVDQGTPVFALLPGGDEFSVTISNEKHGKWVHKLKGQYYQATRSYHFLMLHLAEVEKELGLAVGESGLRDPKTYSKLCLMGEVYSAAGLEELRKKLEPFGITYKRQTKTFQGPLTSLESVKPFMEAPK